MNIKDALVNLNKARVALAAAADTISKDVALNADIQAIHKGLADALAAAVKVEHDPGLKTAIGQMHDAAVDLKNALHALA